MRNLWRKPSTRPASETATNIRELAWGTSVFTRSVASTVANNADLPSDRPEVLEGDEAETGESTESTTDEGDSDAEPSDERAAARSKRPVEVALHV